MDLPATFTRSQIKNVFDALNLIEDVDSDGLVIASIGIVATEVDIEIFVPDEDGGVMQMFGENASVVVTIPVEEDV